jgi:allantoicase/CubicO group peptidase (beta-lactamase class C family)
VPQIREAQDPWAKVQELDPGKFELTPYIQRFTDYFQCLGSQRFATVMARHVIPDLEIGAEITRAFMLEEINEAASFHGDIGEGKKTLDEHAKIEQGKVFGEDEAIKAQLRALGAQYKEKYGMKFLVSAMGKSGAELLEILKSRMNNPQTEEQENARSALWEIALKRFFTLEMSTRRQKIEAVFKKHKIKNAQVAISTPYASEQLLLGEETKLHTLFEVASLSKTVGSAFACEYLAQKGISLEASVNEVLATTKSKFRLRSAEGKPSEWADKVKIRDLMSHHGLNMHYVNGIPCDEHMPAVEAFLEGHEKYGYPPVRVINPPGEVFAYSGGGFLVLEHLLEVLEGTGLGELTAKFLIKLGVQDFTFTQETVPGRSYVAGFKDNGDMILSGRLMFPAFAAGAMGTALSMQQFLVSLTEAYQNPAGHKGLSHDTARLMLQGSDLGCREFMGATMGLGVFIVEAGLNRFAVHQGANDGFRCLYLHCFHGPARGHGMTVLCNAELNGVLFNAEVAQIIVELFGVEGVDTTKFKKEFALANLKQEEIVNIGYRDLLFNAFERARPEEIVVKGPRDPLASFNAVVGAKVLSVSNDLFARAENLVSEHEPIFDPELFGKQGKIMDSWETVRHNPLDRDTLVIALKCPAPIRYIALSTKYHYGNHAPAVRLLGKKQSEWVEFLPKTELEGHSLKRLDLGNLTAEFSEIKVEIFPDGGFSRLGLYTDLPNEVKSSWVKSERYQEAIPQTKKPLSLPFKSTPESAKKEWARLKSGSVVNVASRLYGAEVTKASNEHYGPASQVISPFKPLNMFDGLESARSRVKGSFEEATIRLARPSVLSRVEFDFSYFVNNNPLEVELEGLVDGKWVTLVKRSNAKAFAGNTRIAQINETGVVSELRYKAYPCGGVNRIRAFALSGQN